MNPVKNLSNQLSLNQVGIHSPYWEPYRKLVKAVVLPYQWEVLNDRIPEAEPSRVIKNTGGIGAFPGVRYASESAHIQ